MTKAEVTRLSNDLHSLRSHSRSKSRRRRPEPTEDVRLWFGRTGVPWASPSKHVASALTLRYPPRSCAGTHPTPGVRVCVCTGICAQGVLVSHTGKYGWCSRMPVHIHGSTKDTMMLEKTLATVENLSRKASVRHDVGRGCRSRFAGAVWVREWTFPTPGLCVGAGGGSEARARHPGAVSSGPCPVDCMAQPSSALIGCGAGRGWRQGPCLGWGSVVRYGGLGCVCVCVCVCVPFAGADRHVREQGRSSKGWYAGVCARRHLVRQAGGSRCARGGAEAVSPASRCRHRCGRGCGGCGLFLGLPDGAAGGSPWRPHNRANQQPAAHVRRDRRQL